MSCCRGTFTTGLDFERISRVSGTSLDGVVIGHHPAPGAAFHQSQSLGSKPVECWLQAMWFDCHDLVPVCSYRATLTLAAVSVPEWSVALCGWLDFCDDKHPLRSSRLRIAASQPISALTAKLCPTLPQSPHPRNQFIRVAEA
jgi:hypothetical protein